MLSSHEVSLGYREVQDPSVYVRFPLQDEENTFFLAWTTTPWTLISNAGLAVGPEIDYVKVRHNDPQRGEEFLIVARERLGVLSEDVEIVDSYTGRELENRRYRPLFDYFEADEGVEQAWRVITAGFVSTEDGTGIVHTAPAFGADDYEFGRSEGLPVLNPVAPDGRFTEKAPLVAGMWFKDADKVITRDLRERGLLYKHETYLHNYPHDWRKGTPLMSYPVESWFIRTTAVKDRMMELNDTINWQPKNIGAGRFGEWLKNNVDWALSRRRYWGTPLPIWQSDADPEYVEVIGSIAELREKCGAQLPDEDDALDLHRPFVDDLTWPAPEHVGGTMRRVPDLIDVWFDSGSMPYAQWHYPFENKERFEQNFPADFIAEGVDQTRGWFYTLHAIAALVFDDVAFKNVVVNGLVLAEDGEKMSKSKGNAVDPFETIEQYGADVVRWYMMSNTPPWENIKFAERGLIDSFRKFFSTLENVYSFFATYANIDGFTYDAKRIPVGERTELDRWITSRLNTTIIEVDAALDDYNPTRAARAVETFVEELSNWYIRRSRRRFWKDAAGDAGDGTADGKEAAYQTVYESLVTVAKLMAPIAPFFAEWLFRALDEVTGKETVESVHLTDFPPVEEAAVDADLEHRMGLARTISSIVLGLRNEASINVRQPLPRIMVVTDQQVAQRDVEQMRGVILDEVNVKHIEYIDGSSGVVQRTAKPNFARLGRRLGKLMKPVNARVRELSNDEIQRYIDTDSLTIEVEGQSVEFGPDDLEIVSEGVEGWLVGQEGGVTVALDTSISDELLDEGMAREVVNRVQNMRKTVDYDVTDRIVVAFSATPRLAGSVQRHGDWIRNETLALELQEAREPEGDLVEFYRIGDDEVTLAVRRLSGAS